MADRLAGADVELVLPASFAERIDIVECLRDGSPLHRVAAAALGLCWPRIRRKLPYRGKLLDYGGQVIDLLLREGATMDEVYPVAAKALEVVAQSQLPSQAGVDAAVGNSAAPSSGASSG